MESVGRSCRLIPIPARFSTTAISVPPVNMNLRATPEISKPWLRPTLPLTFWRAQQMDQCRAISRSNPGTPHLQARLGVPFQVLWVWPLPPSGCFLSVVKFTSRSAQTRNRRRFPAACFEQRASMTAVTLVGFMGAGKTTVGRALATRLGWRFQDLDDLIQAREGCTIEQIFRDQGERASRDFDYLVLSHATTTENSGPLVLALGGGAFVPSRS